MVTCACPLPPSSLCLVASSCTKCRNVYAHVRRRLRHLRHCDSCDTCTSQGIQRVYPASVPLSLCDTLPGKLLVVDILWLFLFFQHQGSQGSTVVQQFFRDLLIS
jgi:hypothetical protein